MAKSKARKKKKETKIAKAQAETKTQSKKNKFKCQFCGRNISTQHNLKVHEHHCKSKLSRDDDKKKNDEIEIVFRKFKDEFEDQKEALLLETAEREEILRRELDELRDALRMEIMRTHHEQNVQTVQENDLGLEPIEDTVPEPPVVQPEPIPISAPPRVDIAPEIERFEPIAEPEVVTEPRYQTESFVEPHPPIQQTVQLTPPETQVLVVDEASEAPPLPTVTKEEIAELVREEIKKIESETPPSEESPVETEIKANIENITTQVENLSLEISRLSDEGKSMYEETTVRIEKLNLKRFEREIEKISERVFDIMDEVGFGEGLNVSKIPPNILEIVYQATLDDVVKEMVRSLGNHEAERNIDLALEDVRLKTSGSELFRFDGRKIVTDNLARALRDNLISAKQIQTTYKELLNKLLDTVPHYKAKNFRAMIKIKSQEYAVDKGTTLTVEFERLESNIENMGQMIAAFSSQLNTKGMQLEKEINKVNEVLAEKVNITDMEQISTHLESRARGETVLSEDIGTLKAEIKMLKGIVDELNNKMKEDIKKTKPPEVTETSSEITEAGEEKNINEKILAAVSAGATNHSAIQEATKLSKKDIDLSLKRLVSDNKLVEKGTKGRKKYRLPEEEFEEVVKKKISPKEKKTEPPKPKKKAPPKAKKDEPKPEKPPKKAEPPKPKGKKKEITRPAEEPPEVVKPPKKKSPAKEKKKDEKITIKEKKKPMKKTKLSKPDEKDKVKPETRVKDEVKKKEIEKEDKPKSVKKEDKPIEEDTSVEVEELNIKKFEDLSDVEKKVHDAIPKSGITLPNLKKSVQKEVKYTGVLRALRVLIDSNFVSVTTRGRHTMYQKIKVEKPDKKDNKKKKNKIGGEEIA